MRTATDVWGRAAGEDVQGRTHNRGGYTGTMDASRLVPSWMRLVHRWYAEMTGDFWRKCILCLREYGGHEWRAQPGAIPDPIRGVGHVLTICPACTRAGRAAFQPSL